MESTCADAHPIDNDTTFKGREGGVDPHTICMRDSSAQLLAIIGIDGQFFIRFVCGIDLNVLSLNS